MKYLIDLLFRFKLSIAAERLSGLELPLKKEKKEPKSRYKVRLERLMSLVNAVAI
jgi:hypothetical protein